MNEFIVYLKNAREKFLHENPNLPPNDRIKRVKFEDFVIAYDQAVSKIEEMGELRDLLIAYENFKLMTSEKFSVSEQAIDAFLENYANRSN